MTAPVTELDIERLTTEQKFALIERLWDSIPPADEAHALTPAQLDELDRRIALADANPQASRPWAEVKARLLGDQ